MIDSIELLRVFIIDNQSFEYAIILLGTILGGKFALFALGFLAGQNVISILPTVILGFFGVLLSNTTWFFLGRTRLINKIVLSRYTNATTKAITEALIKLSRNKYLVALAIIEFSIGTPLIMMTYISKTNINFKKFILYQSIVISVSLLVIIPFGFASGLGFTYLTLLFDSLYTAISFILLIALITVMVHIWIKNKFTEDLVDEQKA